MRFARIKTWATSGAGSGKGEYFSAAWRSHMLDRPLFCVRPAFDPRMRISPPRVHVLCKNHPRCLACQGVRQNFTPLRALWAVLRAEKFFSGLGSPNFWIGILWHL